MVDSQPAPPPERVVHELPASRAGTFAQALTMSRQMLALAQEGQWQQLIDLEAKRQQALLDSFPPPAEGQAAERLDPTTEHGQQIQEILKIDEQVQQLVTNERNAIRDELAARSRAQSQAKAYQAPKP